MMTSSNGNIFRVTGLLCGEFPTQRPVTRSFDVFFDLHPNKRLSKQWWGWWFETPSWSLWRQCNVLAWIEFNPSMNKKFIHHNMWNEIMKLLIGAAVDFWKWINKFDTTFYWTEDYLSILGLKLNHTSRRGPRRDRLLLFAINRMRSGRLDASQLEIMQHCLG